jgi:hypothetical protein
MNQTSHHCGGLGPPEVGRHSRSAEKPRRNDQDILKRDSYNVNLFLKCIIACNNSYDTVAYLLKARTVESEKQLLLGNGSANPPIAGQWFSMCHVIATTDAHAKIEELLEDVFSVESVPRLYNEDQLPLRDSPETAVRRVGGWCEMAASLQVREPRSRGLSTAGRCYQAEQWRR